MPGSKTSVSLLSARHSFSQPAHTTFSMHYLLDAKPNSSRKCVWDARERPRLRLRCTASPRPERYPPAGRSAHMARQRLRAEHSAEEVHTEQCPPHLRLHLESIRGTRID